MTKISKYNKGKVCSIMKSYLLMKNEPVTLSEVAKFINENDFKIHFDVNYMMLNIWIKQSRYQPSMLSDVVLSGLDKKNRQLWTVG